MIAFFPCAVCEKKTQMYPPSTPIYELVDDVASVQKSEVVDGKLVHKVEQVPVKRQVQRTKKVRMQNPFSGKIEFREVGLEDYGQHEKTFKVELKLGEESIIRALCHSCYLKYQPLFEQCFEVLHKMEKD